VPLLLRLCESVPHSWARWGALSGLLRFADRARALFEEALWDCEWESRALACGAVALDALAARRRVVELERDAFEESDVREAARQRRDR
jgi:hypothetical protein